MFAAIFGTLFVIPTFMGIFIYPSFVNEPMKDKNGNDIKDHPSLNRIKTCALTGFNVDYTPSGSYMTFNDEKRTMTQYAVQMNFTELNPIYEDDYQDGGASADAFTDGAPSDRKALSEDEIGF